MTISRINRVKPVATITAVGVAKPSAHGQAIANTVTACRNASSSMISLLVDSCASFNCSSFDEPLCAND